MLSYNEHDNLSNNEFEELFEENIEKHFRELMRDRERINFKDLLKLMWHDDNSLQYLNIKSFIEKLEKEGKIIIMGEEIQKTILTRFDAFIVQEQSVLDFSAQKRRIEKNKEILLAFRRENWEEFC